MSRVVRFVQPAIRAFGQRAVGQGAAGFARGPLQALLFSATGLSAGTGAAQMSSIATAQQTTVSSPDQLQDITSAAFVQSTSSMSSVSTNIGTVQSTVTPIVKPTKGSKKKVLKNEKLAIDILRNLVENELKKKFPTLEFDAIDDSLSFEANLRNVVGKFTNNSQKIENLFKYLKHGIIGPFPKRPSNVSFSTAETNAITLELAGAYFRTAFQIEADKTIYPKQKEHAEKIFDLIDKIVKEPDKDKRQALFDELCRNFQPTISRWNEGTVTSTEALRSYNPQEITKKFIQEIIDSSFTTLVDIYGNRFQLEHNNPVDTLKTFMNENINDCKGYPEVIDAIIMLYNTPLLNFSFKSMAVNNAKSPVDRGHLYLKRKWLMHEVLSNDISNIGYKNIMKVLDNFVTLIELQLKRDLTTNETKVVNKFVEFCKETIKKTYGPQSTGPQQTGGSTMNSFVAKTDTGELSAINNLIDSLVMSDLSDLTFTYTPIFYLGEPTSTNTSSVSLRDTQITLILIELQNSIQKAMTSSTAASVLSSIVGNSSNVQVKTSLQDMLNRVNCPCAEMATTEKDKLTELIAISLFEQLKNIIRQPESLLHFYKTMNEYNEVDIYFPQAFDIHLKPSPIEPMQLYTQLRGGTRKHRTIINKTRKASIQRSSTA
jgi:hypothetical protein